MSGNAARARNSQPAISNESNIDSTQEAKESITPELVIALCGPIGSPLHQAAIQIENALKEFGYATEYQKLSDLIRINSDKVGMVVDMTSKFNEVTSLINIGDELRRIYGHDVLTKLAIAKIGGDRRKKYGEFIDVATEAKSSPQNRIKNHRICHVIDSIKNQSELDLLRLVYGDALFAIGVFSPLEVRVQNLEKPGELLSEEIEKLIDIDSGEEFSHGQSVRETFPHSDLFLRVDSSVDGPSEGVAIAQMVKQIRRFFALIFRAAVVTPTGDETAMYAAASAGRNSACISRQVGAAVTSASGELLGVGWNDVPRSGGGLYGKPPLHTSKLNITAEIDERCFAMAGRKCHNDQEKKIIASKVVETLIDGGVLTTEMRDRAVHTIIKDSRVKDLIEFSRAVHAEMHAILGASRVAGDRVIGGKLYVTTYPCHACARHIIAAGITDVYYIEPYRKSLATKLHFDALTESVEGAGKVKLLQFEGVAPRRFIDLFDGGVRKKGGVLSLDPRLSAVPATHVSLRAIPRLEEVVVAEVVSKNLNVPVLLTEGDVHDSSPQTKPAA